MDSNEREPTKAEAIEAAQEALRYAYMAAVAEAEGEQVFRIVDEAVRRYLDQRIDLTRSYLAALADCIRIGLRSSFELQEASVNTWHTLFDAALLVNRAWFCRAAEYG